jgi:hypothetical protein
VESRHNAPERIAVGIILALHLAFGTGEPFFPGLLDFKVKTMGF